MISLSLSHFYFFFFFSLFHSHTPLPAQRSYMREHRQDKRKNRDHKRLCLFCPAAIPSPRSASSTEQNRSYELCFSDFSRHFLLLLASLSSVFLKKWDKGMACREKRTLSLTLFFFFFFFLSAVFLSLTAQERPTVLVTQ
jgi:hypothetical protein